MTISAAIDKLFFVNSEDYSFYFSCLFAGEEKEEQEEVEEALHVLEDAGIKFTDEILEKKKIRSNNVAPAPIRFIDRTFKAVDTDELPF